MIEGFVMFFIGFMFGFISMIAFIVHHKEKVTEKEKKSLINKLSKRESIDSRLKRVKEITTEQLDLQGHASGPQKNALHGRHKNGIIGQIKVLEEEKSEILRSILHDGHDPLLTTIDDSGTVHQMKLSEYMVYMGITMKPKEQLATPEPTPTQKSKFTVYKGGKDDGGETVH